MFKRITVLRYHSVEFEDSIRLRYDEKFYNVTPEAFRSQMQYLKDNGFTTISLNDLLFIENEDKLPKKPILLTFDDGHISHYDTVLPILKELGFRGTFFLVVNDMGRPNRVSWNQVQLMKKNKMDIGSHGVHHEIMHKYSYQNLIIELKSSKLELEEKLGEEIVSFAIPRGLYSHKISNVARGMGYKLVFTSSAGNINLYSNPYCLRRMGVRRDYSMGVFKSIVNMETSYILKRRLGQLCKDMVKNIVGIKNYTSLKNSIFLRNKSVSSKKINIHTERVVYEK
ncbi:MAG: polysaccharide deacetylase family protein [Candidatus Omnitrophica bacterium]|nr:polysaccharide deacetylase family protein [Candidatus Omnitrophota bacterium]